jgi:tripartite-type tricarboxylate transporter receptor subunit TctC
MGKMKGLVVFSDKRLEQYPDVPTVKEKGFDDLANIGKGLYGVGAPKGTPNEIVQILEKAFTKAYQNPECQEELRVKRKVELMFLNSSQFEEMLGKMYVTVSEALDLIK